MDQQLNGSSSGYVPGLVTPQVLSLSLS
eukprot:COSAG03_NODE_9548_length_711_cov_5.544118_1_plen_27_part_10